jgi:hypothetical protein
MRLPVGSSSAFSEGLSKTQLVSVGIEQMEIPLAKLVGAAIGAGKGLEEIDAILNRSNGGTPTAIAPVTPSTANPTLQQFYEEWITLQELVTRKAQLLDYQRHLENYVLPILGEKPLADLQLKETLGLQAELLARRSKRDESETLSVKFVKNIIGGSYRALIADAGEQGLVRHPVFPRKRRMKWPQWEPPEADPFAPEERDAIIEWFRTHTFRHPDGHGRYVLRPHPPFHAFVHTLFWTGLRPSEATGFFDGDIYYDRARAEVRRSRHLYEYNQPKIQAARRVIELFPATVELLWSLRPLHVSPDLAVFTNILGRALDQQAFTRHWYKCLRSLGIRQRGIYCMKDTFVTTALGAGVKIRWLEQQTGEDYATLKKHYSKWMPLEIDSELRRFKRLAPALFGADQRKLSAQRGSQGGQFRVSNRTFERLGMVPRGFEPLPHCGI